MRCVLVVVGYLKTGYYLLYPQSGKLIEWKHVRFREELAFDDIYENGSIEDWTEQDTFLKSDEGIKQWFNISEKENEAKKGRLKMNI